MAANLNVVDTTQSESLGQLAYEAYGDCVGWKSVKGEVLPPWQDQRDSLKAAWHAAANAVAEVFERLERA